MDSEVTRTRPGRIISVTAHLLLVMVIVAWSQGSARSQTAPGANVTKLDSAKKDAQQVPSSADRQKAMQADLDRLLQLARQLKAEVDISRKDELSLKVVRDADEIDKLARSARGRIR